MSQIGFHADQIRYFKSGPLRRYNVITINMRRNTDHETELVSKTFRHFLDWVSRGSIIHWWSRRAQKRDIFFRENVINWDRDQFLASLRWHSYTQYTVKYYYRHNYLMEITIHVFSRALALRQNPERHNFLVKSK